MATTDVEALIRPSEADEERPEDTSGHEPRNVVEAADTDGPLPAGEELDQDSSQQSFTSCTTNPMYVGLGRWTKATHALAGLLVFALFMIALSCAEWRVIKVDREQLTYEAVQNEDVDVLMRMDNESMFFSRRMGVFHECLIDQWNTSEVNFTVPRCGMLEFLPTAGRHDHSYYKILRLVETSMIVGPIVVLLSLVCNILQFRCYLVKKKPLIKCLSALIHLLIFNSLLSLALLLVQAFIDLEFSHADPGYPAPWPSILKRNSSFYPRQFSMILYIIAMIGQFLLLNIDIVIARRFIHLTERGRTRPRCTWFLK